MQPFHSSVNPPNQISSDKKVELEARKFANILSVRGDFELWL